MKKKRTALLMERAGQKPTVGGLRWKAPKVFLILTLAMGVGLSGAALALELTAKGTKYYKDDKLN